MKLAKIGAACVLLAFSTPSLAQLRGIYTSVDPSLSNGDQEQLHLTANGRLKVGLSSATNITPAAAPSSTSAADLVGCVYLSSPPTWSNGWHGSISCTSDGSIRVNDSALTTAVNAQAIATGLKGSPSTQLVSVQDANTFLDSGLQTLSTSGAAYTMDLSAEGSAFTTGEVEVTGVGTGGQLVVNCSVGGTTYPALRLQAVSGGADSGSISTTGIWYFAAPCKSLRFYASALTSGSITFYARLSRMAFPAKTVTAQVGTARTAESLSSNGSAASLTTTREQAVVVVPYAIPESRWQYAAATGGINNSTTAVTICAALASNRCYVTHLDIDYDSLSASTEVGVRDGAGGTVLWRGKLPASTAGSRERNFPVPLKGTAGNLLEFVTFTAVTGAVLPNAQGHYAQ